MVVQEAVSSSYERFREVQHLRTWWYLLLILIPSGLTWWGAISQLVLGTPWGNNPASDELMLFLLVIIGIGLPVLLLNVHMETVVTDSVQVRFVPFMLRPRTIHPQDILSHKAEEYSPLAEYGGWGIKGVASNRAYNVSGRRGVRILLKDGKMIMIGSQKAEELDMVIQNLVRTGTVTSG